jgi:hypothetical protein
MASFCGCQGGFFQGAPISYRFNALRYNVAIRKCHRPHELPSRVICWIHTESVSFVVAAKSRHSCRYRKESWSCIELAETKWLVEGPLASRFRGVSMNRCHPFLPSFGTLEDTIFHDSASLTWRLLLERGDPQSIERACCVDQVYASLLIGQDSRYWQDKVQWAVKAVGDVPSLINTHSLDTCLINATKSICSILTGTRGLVPRHGSSKSRPAPVTVESRWTFLPCSPRRMISVRCTGR